MSKSGLGRGLDALMATVHPETSKQGMKELRINEVEPDIAQPRKQFDNEKLTQLAESIKQHGIIQPIIVRKDKDTYKIVAGERRWRAAKIAGIKSIPVIEGEFSDVQAAEIALIENLQRQDLNPIEEADAYDALIKRYSLTQEQIALAVGKSRSAIANSVRLLSLDAKVKEYVANSDISSGHARALLTVENRIGQLELAEKIINDDLNVRQTEKLVKKHLKGVKEYRKKMKSDAESDAIQSKLQSLLGTKVSLVHRGERGKIIIEYYSSDELDRLIEIFENNTRMK